MIAETLIAKKAEYETLLLEHQNLENWSKEAKILVKQASRFLKKERHRLIVLEELIPHFHGLGAATFLLNKQIDAARIQIQLLIDEISHHQDGADDFWTRQSENEDRRRELRIEIRLLETLL